MEYIHDTTEFEYENTVVTLGKFDGLHLGHQSLFEKLLELEKAEKLTSVVLSLDIRSDTGIRIYTDEERVALLGKRGPRIFISYPFTEKVMNTEPEDFIKEVVVSRLHAKAVVVGDDFRFGKGRKGDSVLLEQLGKTYGFKVYVCGEVDFGGARVSSTFIRNLIIAGDRELAEELMNRKWFEKCP